jgi:hypothetical protein
MIVSPGFQRYRKPLIRFNKSLTAREQHEVYTSSREFLGALILFLRYWVGQIGLGHPNVGLKHSTGRKVLLDMGA